MQKKWWGLFWAPFGRRALGEDAQKGDCGTPDPTSGGQIVPFIR